MPDSKARPFLQTDILEYQTHYSLDNILLGYVSENYGRLRCDFSKFVDR
jgi:hypothetical protein